MKPALSIVIPLFNEEENIAQLITRLNTLLGKIPLKSEVVLVDDGSTDNTSFQIKQIALINERYQAVILARNYGHQVAISAGLISVRATEAIMVMDGDLQDPPEMLMEFYKYYQEGYDVIYGIRKKRKENILKRFAYSLFYRILKSVSYIHIPIDSGDFSLMSRRVVNILNQMPEESRFIRGMRSWIGLKQIGVEYERDRRAAGKPKYSLRKLLQLSYNGIFNFSEFPIKFITRLGFLVITISLFYLILTVIKKYLYGNVPQGFTALLFTIVLFSGVQLVSLGVIGEYVLRIFFQVKGRPLYIIKQQVIEKNIVKNTNGAIKNETEIIVKEAVK